ncbi:hypothetical protein [Tautonia sociabilis]|uniref:Fibronectin type III domain-containing protein n=1 Tax=Tautonia sociabilis TaxID=2080755 RepID=A0A432MMC5_9BACT|nr:hypothetical protein [Tautonia sociabilis]RUL88593.1 hypothetical protein TsocGM_06635 [Tautonia sociabilis]
MTDAAGNRARRKGVGPAIARLAVLLALAIAPPARAAPRPMPTPAPQGNPPPLTYSDSPSFRIPFNLSDPDRMLQLIAEVHLYVSADRGLSWQYAGNTPPSQMAFPYRADHDGEYWFAVRTRDHQDRLYPPDMDQVRPRLRVIVDTTPPSVVLRAMPRRGGVVGVHWSVQDENLDLSTFALEYQVQGAQANSWRRVPARPRLVGEERWEVGTGFPVMVRVTVADRAGNRGVAEVALPDGSAETPGATVGPAAGSAPPPIMQANRPSGRGTIGAGAAPEPDPFAGIDRGASAPGPELEPEPVPVPHGEATPSTMGAAPPPGPTAPPSPAPSPSPAAPPSDPAPASSSGGVLIVGSPRFPLSYDVQDGSAESLAVVEMWVTRDDGRSWESLGTDPDRQSPFFVDLGGDGRYGLRIVVRSQNGLGDPRPTPGTPPQLEVVVDTTAPRVTVDSVALGTGAEAGSLVLSWRTEEPHPAEAPVILSIRPDSPDAIWQQVTPPQPDTGRLAWPLSPNVPSRFFVRLDVFDALGNQSTVETTEPIVLDIPRPRGRILGLDPNARVPAAVPRR